MTMTSSNTLLIRHMPWELSSEEKEDFLKHFGAKHVKVIGSKHKKSSNVYAQFESQEKAEAVLKHLHQTEILGQLLAVEFARTERGQSIHFDTSSQNEERFGSGNKENRPKKFYENFLYRINNWTSKLDLNVPPPVHLKYQYPPPTRMILLNIAKTLAEVPKFYTQVLHLMNKMNLPCPFTENFPIETNILVDHSSTKPLEVCMESNDSNAPIADDESRVTSEESEIESDGEGKKSASPLIVPSTKRKLPDNKKNVKRPKFMKPVAMTNVKKQVTQDNRSTLSTTDVFEKVNEKEILARKIEVKITPDLSSILEAEESQKEMHAVEGFEKLPVNESIETTRTQGEKTATAEEDMNDGSCITEQELASNRISVRDQRILPVFKNYQQGSPSCRLYIKNLAKQVTARDLHYIYRRYLLTDLEEVQGSMFDVRLMQEGRMKGQAFINLQTVEISQKALKETNGFILKDKPMVVQFARSSKAKEK